MGLGRSVLWAAVWLVMPAALAVSIAADRERLCLPEVALTQIRPWEILLAKGLSSGLPFLLMGLLVFAVDMLGVALAPVGADRIPAIVETVLPQGSYTRSRMLLSGYSWPLTLRLLGAILVCVSALCARRNGTGPVLWGGAAGGVSYRGGVPALLQRTVAEDPDLARIISKLVSLGTLVLILALLAPPAARAVGYLAEFGHGSR